MFNWFLAFMVFGCNISNMRDSVSSRYPSTKKRVENKRHGGRVFVRKFEVFV